ncbi:hypothetical protein [Roseateles sp.]|uniref:hypothetical protein n=1 Tax=Roseateles sp. TaxID=1971397 RepID=UPI002F402431
MHSKVYYALELARATTGYDPTTNRTQIRCWRLAVTGPFELIEHGVEEALKGELERVIQVSAETALWESYCVAMATPGEVSMRVAAAWEVFWQRFPVLLRQNARDAASALIDAFSIGVLETVVEEEGLVIVVKTPTNPTVQLYEKTYDWIADRIGGDAGRVVHMYVDLHRGFSRAMEVDIDIRAPRSVNDAMVEVARLSKALKDMPQRIADLADKVKSVPDRLERGLSAVVLEAGQVTQAVVQQLKAAGVPFDFADVGEERLKRLLAGSPKLDWAPNDLGQQLTQIGARMYEDAARQIQAESLRVLSGIGTLTSQIADAAHRGAVELVAQMRGEVDALARRHKELRDAVDRVSGVLQSANLVLPPDITNSMNQAGQGVETAVTQAANAVRHAAEQADLIARGLLDSAGNALEEARNWLEDRLGL